MVDVLTTVLQSVDGLRKDIKEDLGALRNQLQTYHEQDSRSREEMLLRIDRLEHWKEEHEQIEIEQANRIVQLENPVSIEKRWAERHPILAGGVNYILLIIIFCLVAHFLPAVAHLIGSI